MQLKPDGQGARLARYGFMKWFTAIDVTMNLRITQVHARINDIRSAGGEVVSEDVWENGVKFCRYMVRRMPALTSDVAIESAGGE